MKVENGCGSSIIEACCCCSKGVAFYGNQCVDYVVLMTKDFECLEGLMVTGPGLMVNNTCLDIVLDCWSLALDSRF